MSLKAKIPEKFRSSRRRGVVAIQVAVMITVIVGFAALTIDVGAMYNAKADLQRTADAAALAAAARLSEFGQDRPPMELARDEARMYASRNPVFGRNGTMVLDDADIEFGRANFDSSIGGYTFTPTSVLPDAVRIRVRLETGSSNGPLGLYFARIFGRESADLSAEAVAMMSPRDIALVADLSASHTDDSEFMHYQITEINLHEVWDAFPGGIDDAVSTWDGNEFPLNGDGYSPQMGGPAWGYMKKLGYGTERIDGSYNPNTDPGLVHLPQGYDWSNAALRNYLGLQGYSTTEVDAIMSNDYDGSGAWPARVAVALGLARWNSGIPGGLWQKLGLSPYQAGNGNGFVGTGEMTWQETFGDRSISQSKSVFENYISSYMASTSSRMYTANHNLRYKFGVKTFMNYLLESRPVFQQTPEFVNTPQQPMKAVKDAVAHLVQTVYDLNSSDQMSLEIYGTHGRHEVDLRNRDNDFFAISRRLNEMQAAHYDGNTNMGAGIERAIEELHSERANPIARKVMVLLTDGYANVGCDGCSTYNAYAGRAYALEAAGRAADMGIQIFAVSVGAYSDQNLMDSIAELGGGTHFHAEGEIQDYSAQLDEIFRRLGGRRPVELIR